MARSITINKQHLLTNKERQRILCEKVHSLHSGETETAVNHCAILSIRKMSSTPSSINLAALGNNFVKKVPTMEVNTGHLKAKKKMEFTTKDVVYRK